MSRFYIFYFANRFLLQVCDTTAVEIQNSMMWSLFLLFVPLWAHLVASYLHSRHLNLEPWRFRYVVHNNAFYYYSLGLYSGTCGPAALTHYVSSKLHSWNTRFFSNSTISCGRELFHFLLCQFYLQKRIFLSLLLPTLASGHFCPCNLP
jgi:hypothetical protein